MYFAEFTAKETLSSRLYATSGFEEGLGLLIDPVKHRANRKRLSPMFSQTAIDELAPRFLSMIERTANGLANQIQQGKVIDAYRLYSKLTVSYLCPAFFSQIITI
jgi:cytochrome P450